MSFVLPSNVDEDFIHYTYINDDVLYVVRNGIGRDIYYLFHLTYSAHNVDGFPRYEEFADIFAVKEFIERSYIEDYM